MNWDFSDLGTGLPGSPLGKSKELAKAVGVTKDTVRNWERYSSMTMSENERLKRACSVLGLDLEFPALSPNAPLPVKW